MKQVLAPRGAVGAGVKELQSSGNGLLWGHFLVLIPSQGWPTPYTLIQTGLWEFVQAGSPQCL